MRKKIIHMLDSIVSNNDAIYTKFIKNPVRYNNDNTVTIFCNSKGNIVECKIDKEDLSKLPNDRYVTANTRKHCKHVRFIIADKQLTYYILNRKNANDGNVVDHINRDTTDNRRCNLRVVKQGVNMLNKNIYKNARSKEKNFSQQDDYYKINFNRKFYNKAYALEARDKIEEILNEYTIKDLKYR